MKKGDKVVAISRNKPWSYNVYSYSPEKHHKGTGIVQEPHSDGWVRVCFPESPQPYYNHIFDESDLRPYRDPICDLFDNIIEEL